MFKAIKYVCTEHINSFNTILYMALAHTKKQTIRTSLGLGWVFIKDIVYFTVFILFRYVMSSGKQIEGMNFIVYLMTGLVPWFFMNDVINSGSNAIIINKSIIKSLKFPITILPTIETMAIFMKRFFTIFIAFAVEIIFGYIANFNIFLFLYYFIAMFMLMISFNLFITGFIAISEDFAQLYSALTRILFFSLPIIWSFEYIEEFTWVITLLKANPMVYIITGFRDAFVLGMPPEIGYSIYYWLLTFVLFGGGCITQYRLRKYYADFI